MIRAGTTAQPLIVQGDELVDVGLIPGREGSRQDRRGDLDREDGRHDFVPLGKSGQDYSTVTDLARFRGLSTSVPRISAVW